MGGSTLGGKEPFAWLLTRSAIGGSLICESSWLIHKSNLGGKKRNRFPICCERIHSKAQRTG